MVAYEMKSNASVTSRGGGQVDSDNAHLQRMGKKPVLKRNFGILSILGFSCTILGTWEGLLGTFTGPLTNGGSGGAIYAYIFGWVGCLANFMVLSELASMAPTAGGQYHWAAMLAPAGIQNFLSFITGWFAVLGWQSAFAACAFLTGKMIQGAAILGNNLYNALPWQGTLIVWALLGLALVVNLLGGNLLPRIEVVILVAHVLGFFGIIIPLAYLADHNTKEEVFLSFQNGGGFATQGLSWFVGMTSCAFAFAGGDAAVHMSEEVANASTVIPNALMISVGLNGCLGFGMILVMMFCADSDLGVTIAALLALINVGSSAAMEDVVSMAVSGIYLSYLVVSVLLFYRRIRGDISRYDDNEDNIVNVPGAKLVWGPFHCPGIIGTLINGYAIIYIAIVIFFSFWPSTMDPTVETMNWSILAIGGSVFLAIIYYVVRARHIYKGPIVEVSM
ncbi:Amino acid/polyamine transporter I [Penicillium italicum]|uniref:Amino acid/polyamine transporter I n=1 Tax=Penicillium italicum TaxID=40296 RepID=A0A0A2L1T3_PENIT|nr:Amino acid/polyamine transporter I [Penicillium italicum]